jgi:type IV pilus assembly protein PilN
MITINLLPVREERRRAGVVQLVALMGVSLLVSLAITALVHWSVRSDVTNTLQMAAQTQTQIDQFGPQLKQVEEYRNVKADIERKLDVISQLSDARSGPVHVFDEISSQIPDRVWLQKIEVREGQLKVQGMSLDNELVALFLTGLEDSAYFKDVELLRTEAKEEDGFKLNAFEVSAKLTSPNAERLAREAAARTASGDADRTGSKL